MPPQKSAIRAVEIVRRLCPNARPEYLQAFEQGDVLLLQHGLVTKLRLAHFLAQVLHESGGLRIVREDMRYSAGRIVQIFGVGRHSAAIGPEEAKRLAGDGRGLVERVYGEGNPRKARELGNTEPGDGWNFRGNGILQATGRGAHRRLGQKCGVDFEANPALVTAAEHALKPALAEWAEGNLNGLADANNIRAITRRINGGYNGLADRIAWFDRVWKIVDETNGWVAPRDYARTDPETKAVQGKLVDLGYDVPVDGTYDPKTEAAVRDFQTRNHLLVDGIAGPVTIAALDARLAATRAPAEATLAAAPLIEDPVARGRDVAGGLSVVAVLEWIAQLSDKVTVAPVLRWVIVGLAVVAAALFLWGFVRPRIWPPRQGEVSTRRRSPRCSSRRAAASSRSASPPPWRSASPGGRAGRRATAEPRSNNRRRASASPRRWTMPWRVLVLLGTGLLSTGCATTTPTSGTDPKAVACRAFGPLTYSRRDAAETIGGIRGHNAAYGAVCGAER